MPVRMRHQRDTRALPDVCTHAAATRRRGGKINRTTASGSAGATQRTANTHQSGFLVHRQPTNRLESNVGMDGADSTHRSPEHSRPNKNQPQGCETTRKRNSSNRIRNYSWRVETTKRTIIHRDSGGKEGTTRTRTSGCFFGESSAGQRREQHKCRPGHTSSPRHRSSCDNDKKTASRSNTEHGGHDKRQQHEQPRRTRRSAQGQQRRRRCTGSENTNPTNNGNTIKDTTTSTSNVGNGINGKDKRRRTADTDPDPDWIPNERRKKGRKEPTGPNTQTDGQQQTTENSPTTPEPAATASALTPTAVERPWRRTRIRRRKEALPARPTQVVEEHGGNTAEEATARRAQPKRGAVSVTNRETEPEGENEPGEPRKKKAKGPALGEID